MSLADNLFENLRLELRRGCLTLAVLAQLQQEHDSPSARLWRSMASKSTKAPSTRCCWPTGNPGALWSASGGKKRNATGVFTASRATAKLCFCRLLQEWRALNKSIDNNLARKS